MMHCLTVDSPGNNQLLYFTSPSLTTDGRTLVLISDRTGDPNLVARDLASGRERVLTMNRHGWLRSYVYFDGRPGEGLGRASVSLDAARGVVYFIEGRTIRAVDVEGGERTLATLPNGLVTAFTHVSADGRFLCVPVTDARALEGHLTPDGRPAHDIDARVQADRLSSWLRIYDTANGELVVNEPVPLAWVTHVQFDPCDNRCILYNHEWSADSGIRRMWIWDGVTHRPLRCEDGVRSRHDWACHEMWVAEGRGVVYHGGFAGGACFLGRADRDGGLVEIALPRDFTRYGHFTADRTGTTLVSDGYYQDPSPVEPGDTHRQSGHWISLQRVDWENRAISWVPLCRHGSSWRSQDEHPHPVFADNDQVILFTSDRGGRRAVWRTAVPH
jgi:hypothetical protein